MRRCNGLTVTTSPWTRAQRRPIRSRIFDHGRVVWFTAITELSCFSSGNCILLTERSLVGIQVQPHRRLSGCRLKISPIGHAPSGARSPWRQSLDPLGMLLWTSETKSYFLFWVEDIAWLLRLDLNQGVEDDSDGVAACHRPRCGCTSLPARRS